MHLEEERVCVVTMSSNKQHLRAYFGHFVELRDMFVIQTNAPVR
jgi:hypothetical protein